MSIPNAKNAMQLRAARNYDITSQSVCFTDSRHHVMWSFLTLRTYWSATEKKVPQTPKYAKHTTLTSEVTLQKEIGKIPRKYQKNTPKIRISEFFLYSGGYLKGCFGESHFCMLGGIFDFLLSYSVAGRWVLSSGIYLGLFLADTDRITWWMLPADFKRRKGPHPHTFSLSCTRLRVPPVALHLSRYTCRSWFPGFYSVLQV